MNLVLRAVAVLASMVLMGCASANLPTVADPVSVCVPPGMPPLEAWQSVTVKPTVIADDHKRPVMVLEAAYLVVGVHVKAWWIGGAMVAVDPDVQDDTKAAWYDWGLMDSLGRLRSGSGPLCEWKRTASSDTTLLRAP